MKKRFLDRVALVTGGSSGIGRAAALAFASEGAKVVVADIQTKGGEETVRLIKNIGTDATFVRTDISKASDVQMLIAATVKTYGRLDVAHNNAGVESGLITPTADYPEDNWDRVVSINLTGT